MRIFLITDTHFSHDWVLQYRPADFEARILDHWRRRVRLDDLVIHLGDVTFEREKLAGLLDSLPGTKVLVRGNHDHDSPTWFMRHGFALACDALLMRHVLFTHRPSLSLHEGAEVNIHGHLHNDGHRFDEWNGRYPHHCRLLALEHWDYAPVELDTFLRKYHSINACYPLPAHGANPLDNSSPVCYD
jgi:calcineurin-like phosphoesterase family protein